MLGHIPALACAPNNDVADCLALILAVMPFNYISTSLRSLRLSDTPLLSKCVVREKRRSCEIGFDDHEERLNGKLNCLSSWFVTDSLHGLDIKSIEASAVSPNDSLDNREQSGSYQSSDSEFY